MLEKWLIKNNNMDFMMIAREMGFSEILSKILVNREIYDLNLIDRFLNSDIDKLYSPTLMRDLSKGGNILKDKIENRLPIRIVGDFDVDGVISVYVLYITLKRLGAVVDYVIPDRVNDGYGINN